MRDLARQERTAIEAVARQFSATWEEGDDPPEAYIRVEGKRVAVDIATLKGRGTGEELAGKPRLRFDKVVTRLMERLQATLGETVPEGVTVLLTVTAPIRLPAKTAAALEDRIETLLGRGSPGREEPAQEESTMHGNRVRIRLVREGSEHAPRMIGCVHNPDSDPGVLLDMAGEWVELIGAVAGRRAPELAGERWLVVIGARASSWLEAYRYIHSQLRMAGDFTKVLMVFGDGRVGMLAG
jgi:hypothetical protein